MDPRVQDLQGKAERVKPNELLSLIEGFYREKAALRGRHVAAARFVGQYDFNNAYQYVIAREDQHLAWVADAILRLGGTVPETSAVEIAPPPSPELERELMAEDARQLEAFAQSWRPRLEPITNARDKLMLELVLGEVAEQARFFRQGAGGRLDLLGRRTGGERVEGRVLPTRWVE